MNRVDAKGLEAAHIAYERFGQDGDLRTRRISDSCMLAVISAYLSTPIAAGGGEAPTGSMSLDEIWADATNSVCQTMQDKDMCLCPEGQCLASTVTPAAEDRAYFASRAALSTAGAAEPVAIEIARRLFDRPAFMTTVSGAGDPYVKIAFKTLRETHSFQADLAALSQAVASPHSDTKEKAL